MVESLVNISGYVKSIGTMGEVEIVFNESMLIPQNLSWINSSVLDIYVA